jgi:hypothetical protein
MISAYVLATLSHLWKGEPQESYFSVVQSVHADD